jgi:hypothetical protein
MFKPVEYKEEIKKGLTEEAKNIGLTETLLLNYLLYLISELDVNLVILIISYHYKKGMNLKQINQLRILNSYIYTLLDRIK